MEIKVRIKMAWWWKSACWVVLFLALCRLVTLENAERAIEAVMRRAFMWRTGGKWRRFDSDFVSLERQ